jgi:hypothetical protein
MNDDSIDNTINYSLQDLLLEMKSFTCSTRELREKVVDEYFPFQVIYRLDIKNHQYALNDSVRVLCFRTKTLTRLVFQCIYERYLKGDDTHAMKLSIGEIEKKMNLGLPQTLDVQSQFSSYTYSNSFFERQSVLGWMYCRYFHNEGWKTFADRRTMWNVTRHDARVGYGMIPEFIILVDFTTPRPYKYKDVFGW